MAELHLELYGFIGEKMWEDEQIINLKDIKTATEDAGPESEIFLHINSGGGETFEGFAIYDYLNSLPSKITTIIEGLCGSMATIIALVADEVQMMPNAMFFVHKPSGMAFGEEEDVRSVADLLEDTGELAIDVYEAKCGKDRETIREWMVDNKFFTAKEALEVGLIDMILEPAEAPNGNMKNYRPAFYMDLNFFKHNSNILNMAKSKNGKFSKLKALLGITEVTGDIEITLGNAKKAVIKSEAEQPEVGDEMIIDGKPAEDGTHIAAGENEGRKFTTKDGKITAIEEPVIDKNDDDEEEEEQEEAQELADAITAAVQKATAPLMKELKAIKAQNVSLKTAVKSLEDQQEVHVDAFAQIMGEIESGGFVEKPKGSRFNDDKDSQRNRAEADTADELFKAKLAERRQAKLAKRNGTATPTA